MTPRWQASPNFGERRGGANVSLVVLHYTAMRDPQAAVDWLCSPQAQVSAHYLIAHDGEVVQMVDEAMRAWHAGAGSWGTTEDVNSASIGIELANDGFSPFAAPQMSALERLLGGILERHNLPPKAVIGHSDMSPGRKIDPGPRFDWRRLALGGLSIWPTQGAVGNFSSAAARFGYPVESVGEQQALTAFRLRFRPWADGPLDDTDTALAADLAQRFAPMPTG